MAEDDGMEEAAVQINSADGADDSSDGSSSESDSDGMDIPPDQLERLMNLETELEANISLYDKHLEYIDLLRQLKLKVKLRSAHERMASKFPLSEQLWLDWVNDELEQVKSGEDVEFIKSLFTRSAGDYLSVELWTQYLEFLCELDAEVQGATPAGLKLMRDACEAALTAAGTHVTGGARVWAVYRQFELGLLSDAAAGVDPEKQCEKVRSLYQRQLHLPLVGNDQVLQEYTAWEESKGKAVPAAVLKAVEKAGDALSLRLPYEEAIAPGKEPDAGLLAAYMAYIKLEQSQGDPGRVQVLYERAVCAFPLTVELWSQYCRYLDTHIKLPRLTAQVAARATRNCYWAGGLWATAIRAADRAGVSGGEVTKIAEDALAAGMQSSEEYLEVLLAQLDALRRRVPQPAAAGGGGQDVRSTAEGSALREAFKQAVQLMAIYFPNELDRSLRLPSYWAHCEQHVLGDLAAARAVWDEACKTGLARYTEVWSAAANLERSVRHVREARAVYKRAYSRRFDEGGQYYLCLEWLRFEREEGSAEEYAQALSKVGPILDEAAASAATASADEQTTAAAKAAAKALSPEEMKKMRQASDPNFHQRATKGKGQAGQGSKAAPSKPGPPGGGKRPLDQGDDDQHPSATKRARLHGEDMQPPSEQAADASMETEQPGDVHERDASMEPSEEGGQQHETTYGAMPASDELTVFVRGLPYNTSEQQVQKFFSSCGRINNIRIPRHQNGDRRNFAYVDFCTEDGLKQAVAKDGTCMPGSDTPLMVAKSNRSNLGPGGGRGRGRQGGGRGRGRGGFDAGGRGRGGGHEGGGGRGGHDEGGHGQQGYHGGRGGGGGRGHDSGGRGRPPLFGLGHSGRGGEFQPRAHLEIDSGGGGSAAPGGGRGGDAGGSGTGQPMSNKDFRAMLMSGKKG